jgi:sugar phosphate isomerase/epimerase
MVIGCGTVLYREFPLEAALEAIRGIGYEYFETQAVGPWCPHVDVEKDDPEMLIKLKNKFGFKGITGLWSLNGNIISNPAAVESGIRSVEWAAAAGIPVVHTGDGHKPEGMSDDEAFKVLEEKLRHILEAARKHHVIVAIEPHGTFSLTGEGLKRIMEIDTPDVLGINYDACNIFRAGYVESAGNKSGRAGGEKGEDELAVLKTVRSRVVHCHVKDIDGGKNCVALGKGLVNVRGCIEYLLETDYGGVVSVETEGGGDFDEVTRLAEESYRYLKQLISGE